MKFCERCSVQVEEDIKFCHNCGNKLSSAEASAYSEPSAPPAHEQQPQQQHQPPPQPVCAPQPYYAPPQPGNMSATVSLIMGIVGIVSMAFPLGIVGFLFAKTSNKEQTKAGLPPLTMAKAGNIISIIAIAIGGLYFLGMIVYLLFYVFIFGIALAGADGGFFDSGYHYF